jgi:hypothetical protein
MPIFRMNLLPPSAFYAENEGTEFLRDTGKYLPAYTSSHPVRWVSVVNVQFQFDV